MLNVAKSAISAGKSAYKAGQKAYKAGRKTMKYLKSGYDFGTETAMHVEAGGEHHPHQ